MFVRTSTEGTGPLGPAGGDLAGTYPNPSVIGLTEPSGPTDLVIGAVPTLTFLQRVGATVVGTDPNTVVKGPWATNLYVDNVRGSDVTGTRGNNNLPFATIQAAINAASNNDVILLAAQTFALTVELTRPATLTTFTMQGVTWPGFSGGGATQVSQATAGQAVFNLSVNLGLSQLTLRNFFIFGRAGVDNAILADGSVAGYAASAYLGIGLVLDNMQTFGPITLKNVVTFNGIGGLWFGDLVLTSVRTPTLTNVDANGNTTLTFDNDDAAAPVATTYGLKLQGGARLGSTDGKFVTMSKQARIYCDSLSMIGGLKGSGLTINAGATKFPIVDCSGYIGNGNSATVDFASAGAELPDTVLALAWSFRGTRFWWTSSVTKRITQTTTVKFKVGGAAVNFQTVIGQASEGFGMTFIADAAITLDMRGSLVTSPVWQTPGANGQVTPAMLTGTISLAAGGTVAQTWAGLGYVGLVRTTSAPDTVFLTESAQLSDPAVSAKAGTGFTTVASVVGGDTACNWMAVWK